MSGTGSRAVLIRPCSIQSLYSDFVASIYDLTFAPRNYLPYMGPGTIRCLFWQQLPLPSYRVTASARLSQFRRVCKKNFIFLTHVIFYATYCGLSYLYAQEKCSRAKPRIKHPVIGNWAGFMIKYHHVRIHFNKRKEITWWQTCWLGDLKAPYQKNTQGRGNDRGSCVYNMVYSPSVSKHNLQRLWDPVQEHASGLWNLWIYSL